MREPKRIQRKRTKGWRMPPNTVNVARPGRWGNPFRGPKAIHLYRLLWRRRWKELERAGIDIGVNCLPDLVYIWTLRLHELRGKDLVCWCPLGADCHADILLRKANA